MNQILQFFQCSFCSLKSHIYDQDESHRSRFYFHSSSGNKCENSIIITVDWIKQTSFYIFNIWSNKAITSSILGRKSKIATLHRIEFSFILSNSVLNMLKKSAIYPSHKFEILGAKIPSKK